ncbi:hypothetical protein LZ32DRAFT_650883 [Colletotrichum eremochloae]|nr:hypothetical protein LZ32DRAFT_650883 [Colletotrichum eremochloae]
MATKLGSPTRSRGKRVSAQHTLERVRNNQRRHRARQKEYIATLEAKLGNAERTISALEHRVESLQSELAQLRCQSDAVCSSMRTEQRDTSPALPPSGHSTIFQASDTIFNEETVEATILSTTLPIVSHSLGELSLEPQNQISADGFVLADGSRVSCAPSPMIQSFEATARPRVSSFSPSYDASCALELSPTMLPARSTGTDGRFPTSATLDGSWMQMVPYYFQPKDPPHESKKSIVPTRPLVSTDNGATFRGRC